MGRKVPCGFSPCRRWGCLRVIDEFFVIIRVLGELLGIVSLGGGWLSGFSVLYGEIFTVAMLAVAAVAASWEVAKDSMEAMISKDTNLVIFIYIITDGVKLVIVNIFCL